MKAIKFIEYEPVNGNWLKYPSYYAKHYITGNPSFYKFGMVIELTIICMI